MATDDAAAVPGATLTWSGTTPLDADATEWCTGQPGMEHVLAVATYQLDDGATQKKSGRFHLFTLDGPDGDAGGDLVERAAVDTSAVFDVAWSPAAPRLAVVDSDGYLGLYRVDLEDGRGDDNGGDGGGDGGDGGDDGNGGDGGDGGGDGGDGGGDPHAAPGQGLAVTEESRAVVADGGGSGSTPSCLFVDWETDGGGRLVVSHNDGSVTLMNAGDGGGAPTPVCHWEAHSLEVWTAVFGRGGLIYTGTKHRSKGGVCVCV